jgi:hypothetical protein
LGQYSNNYNLHIVKSVHHKMTKHKLVITQADKGKTVAIIIKSQYHKKIMSYINEK